MQQLVLRIPEHWERSRPYTNNRTEQAIGRLLQVRSQTMRGFKKAESIERFVCRTAAMERHGTRVEVGRWVAGTRHRTEPLSL
jgi:hypothetical protein